MPDISADFIKSNGVRKDWVDLRDQSYVPNLSVLRDHVSINPNLMRADPNSNMKFPCFGVRNQNSSGRCVGFALANLIDIQRNLQRFGSHEIDGTVVPADESRSKSDIVSADMLYRMAFFHERYPDAVSNAHPAAEGVRTLRSVIKGFYHHGVCLDWPQTSPPVEAHRWQSDCYLAGGADRSLLFPTVAQAKTARNIGLGAYFRLASVLNHFHAALNDAEAILTTANIHDGWTDAFKPDSKGVITWPPKRGKEGTHAFVVVGYDELGFHVLNSWGETWGGYKKQAGIALWPYADWAENVVDSWVLRLGVFAPSAFGATVGEKGTKGLYGAIQAGSTPCFELVGHYAHLDDGFHVTTGSYPSFNDGWSKTKDYLGEVLNAAKTKTTPAAASAKKGVLVWIPGSLEGIKPAFSSAVKRKNLTKTDLKLYPYTIFWCNSFVEKSMEVLESLFESCKAQAGENAEHLDDLIESRVRGVGRAFWRDIEMSARRTLRGTGELPYEPDEVDKLTRLKRGFLSKFLEDLFELKSKTGAEIHLVAEGAGALVVHEILALLDEDAKSSKISCKFGGIAAHDLLDTLHLVHPAIGMPRANKLVVPLLEKMNDKISQKQKNRSRKSPAVAPYFECTAPAPARLYIPTHSLEKRICFGTYGKSILHLVSRAFEDRYLPPSGSEDRARSQYDVPRTFLGMAEVTEQLSKDALKSVMRLNGIASQTHALDRVSQTVLSNDTLITENIFENIKLYRDTKN